MRLERVLKNVDADLAQPLYERQRASMSANGSSVRSTLHRITTFKTEQKPDLCWIESCGLTKRWSCQYPVLAKITHRLPFGVSS